MAKIGFIGLGNMGGPMAAHLINAKHQVKGFDVVSGCITRFTDKGGLVAKDVTDAASDVDIIITMLPAGNDVRDVYLGTFGILQTTNSKPLLIDCSTIDVETARKVSNEAEKVDFSMRGLAAAEFRSFLALEEVQR